MIDRDTVLKSLAEQMARDLCSSGGTPAVALMHRFGLLVDPDVESGTAMPSLRPGSVGIWEPEGETPGGYRRSPARREEWELWADRPEIPPKGERKRIVLLGESVARGYFYDPEFTPAEVLTSLASAASGQSIEVIDLAKTDLVASELASLAGAALALRPDAFVIFAGNNWAHAPSTLPDNLDRYLAATVLRQRGASGYRELREQVIAEQVDHRLRRNLSQLAARVPVVLIVPEFNLADWRMDAEVDCPWLPGCANRRWLDCRTAAREALSAGQLDEAAALAREMVELDQGTAASGWAILAECAQRAGQPESARACFEKARDARIWDTTPQPPKTLTVIQEALRRCAMPGRISVVDLPVLFSAWLGGGLPDRRLFLDYCHLNAEGIQLAMAAAARAVVPLLGGTHPELPTLEELVAQAPAPSPRLAAEARFTAAIHCAHWGQVGPIIPTHCHEAARCSPEVAQAMREYIEVQVRKAPRWACAAAGRLSALSTPAMRRYVLTRGQESLFDPVLLPAIADALESTGSPSQSFLDELRIAEWSLSEHPSSLVDPYFRTSWLDRDYIWQTAYFYRTHAPVSLFPFICAEPRAVDFALTCRTTAEAGGTCQLLLSGAVLSEIVPTSTWTTFRLSTTPANVKVGINCLEIRWPLDLRGSEKEIQRAATDLECGRSFSLVPVFAEIHSLTAVLA